MFYFCVFIGFSHVFYLFIFMFIQKKNQVRKKRKKNLHIDRAQFRTYLPQERKGKNESILDRFIRKSHAKNHELE